MEVLNMPFFLIKKRNFSEQLNLRKNYMVLTMKILRNKNYSVMLESIVENLKTLLF